MKSNSRKNYRVYSPNNHAFRYIEPRRKSRIGIYSFLVLAILVSVILYELMVACPY
jgi:hypothetical protein